MPERNVLHRLAIHTVLNPATLALVVLQAACGSQAVSDPIPDIPASRQRVVTRSEFRWRWPFTVGAGTLGCESGAIVFRHDGRSYALNETAAGRGYASAAPIQLPQPSRPPSNPLARIKQEERTQVFAAAAACQADACRQRLRETHGISEAELKQIEAEGRERLWPPLVRGPKDVGPLLEAGLKLCQG